ncbi:MAG: hypothetical protein M0Q21_01130 [Ignavibacteriaceae bacterium]|nr:hypothetical protein [Ignavibacteriaceae bacterium]
MTPNKALLFINTSVLGDVTISSLLLDDEIFLVHDDIYFLYPDEYFEFFTNYNGKVKLLPYNQKKYKWSLSYRIRLLSKLRRLKLEACFNLTSARRTSGDEIALLSGANKIYCFENSWRKNLNAFSKIVDTMYSEILFKGVVNEYERHFLVMELFGWERKGHLDGRGKFLNKCNNLETLRLIDRLGDYLVVAPLAADPKRTWGKDNYITLIKKFSEHLNIAVIGSKHEKKELNELFTFNNNKVSVFAGSLSLNDIAFLIYKSKLFVGNDSGLTHLALCTKTPIIAIIGGGTFGKYLPFDDSEIRKYFYYELECFGCEWKCIYDERYCLKEVKLEDVYNTATKLLNN